MSEPIEIVGGQDDHRPWPNARSIGMDLDMTAGESLTVPVEAGLDEHRGIGSDAGR